MDILIVEIKARSKDQDKIREILNDNKADFKGIDHQIDTYFNVNHGRLKLREGKIENNLIHYHRDNQLTPKDSKVLLYKSNPESTLKDVLISSCGIKVVIDKQREIYFIDNVKFHIDTVNELGNFVEIEAIDETGEIGKEKLLAQCNTYMNLLGITQNDLLLQKKQ